MEVVASNFHAEDEQVSVVLTIIIYLRQDLGRSRYDLVFLQSWDSEAEIMLEERC